MEFNIKLLTNSSTNLSNINFGIIDSIQDYDDFEAIIIKNLNPDFYLLFGSIKLIITGVFFVLQRKILNIFNYLIILIK